MENEERGRGLSRRNMLKTTLRAGIYTAPAILSLSAVASVGAAAPSSPPTATPTSVPSPTPLSTPTPIPFPTTLTFGQDALLANTGAGASFDVYYTLSTQPATMLTFLGTFPTDRFGFGGSVFPLTVNTSMTTSVTLTYILHGNPPTSPPAATFTSTLVSALNPVNGMRQPVSFVGLVVQEPTVAACQVGPLNQFTEYVDVAILNATPNTSYTISVQSNLHTAPVVVTTATTNADGNVTVFAGVVTPVVVATPTSVVVTATPTGGGTPLTLTASGTTLTTIGCASLQSAALSNAARTAQAIGITKP